MFVIRSLDRAVRALSLALLCSALLPACVIVQKPPPPPSPLKGVQAVSVEFDYSGLFVEGMGSQKTEAEWVAAKTAEDPDYPDTWSDLKSKWEEYYMAGLQGSMPVPVRPAGAEPPAQGGALLKVNLTALTMGKYIPFATKRSSVLAMNSWLLDGQVVEQNQTDSSFSPSLTTPSIFQHIRTMGSSCGKGTAHFFRTMQR